ncbi:adenosylcobinamide-GDP ribazoletransferase [Cohnella mopanensis]|uniref:adenosylcobinamide-GDP ribazoletransferase n=1 Tax=Cohnella mopanensis TaxID=2911966 RepID=UPI001EF96000|nr:adenosylcobinamide-GDP ribazoletransferase [Cohnella mopanensis]
MNAFWQALGFLTRFPVPARAQTTKGWDNSPRYYPLVGLLLGAVLWLVSWVAQLGFGELGFTVAAVVIVASWIYLTGALHLDGWMDLADGVGSHRSRERMLEIMKDSRVGAMGVVAAIVLIGLKVAALQQLAIQDKLGILLFVPAMARFALLGAIYVFPYIQAQGLGSGLRKGVNSWSLSLNLILILVIAYFVAGWNGAAVLAGMLVAAWLFGRSIVRKLGGFTGDGYGAMVEAMETFVLLLYLILINHPI